MDQELSKVKEYMKSKGIRITPTRLRVIREVFQTHEHFDAERLYVSLARKARSVSRATVYRTLEILVDGGFVRKNRFQESFDRYEHVLGHRPHAHLICLECKRICEFEDSRLNSLLKKKSNQAGFETSYYITQIFGICPDCLQGSLSKPGKVPETVK
ncbi:Fur family transcriptional regulator [Acidobacteriota bacterium]